MNFKSIKKQLESEEYFKYWNKAIGLTFEDFSILVWLDDKTMFTFKEGKKDIGTRYAINIKDDAIVSYNYDINNELSRLHRLEQIAC